MINKIKRLKNIGKFYDFDAKGSGLDWHKNTFLFSPNAYGKSTLVNVLISLREDDPKLIRGRRTLGAVAAPEAVIVIDEANHVFNGTRWDRPFPSIQIFDAPYIHANILAHEIEYEHRKNGYKIIIGAQGIILAEELASLKAKEKGKSQEVSNLVARFNGAGFTLSLDAFLAVPDAEEAAVGPRIEKLGQDLKSKESETQVRGLGFPQGIFAPAFDIMALKSLVAQKLASAHEAAEKRVLAHIDRNFKNKAQAKDFIRQGLDLVQADCPFCGEDMKPAADLLKAYREFFDNAFRTYQQNLALQAGTLAKWNLDNDLTALVSAHDANLAKLKQWEPYIGVDALPDIAGSVEAFRHRLSELKAAVQDELEKKQKDPGADADLPKFDAFAAELAALKTAVESCNAAVAAFIEKAKQYVADLPKSDIASIQAEIAKEEEIKKRFAPEWKKWATDYPTVKKEADDLLTKKNAKQAELASYTKTIFETYQERINELLLSMGADFAVTDLIGKTDERANESYSDFGFLILQKKVPISVRQDDAPCFKNTLSEGDKSTLAFAFFMAALERKPELDKQIVIFDDPLSSLDETRREATARLLLELTPKLNQLCVCTHMKDFLRMLFDKMPDNKVLQVRSDKTRGSRLEPLDVEEDRKSDLARMVEGMERYIVEDFGPTPDTMQANIRKVFEVVLKTKYYRALKADIKAKKSLGKLLETLFDAGLLDAALKPKLFDLCSLTSSPHHGEIVDAPSKKLTRDELIPLINDALSLLEKV
jgi:wobble nucleotide-excising tRNase